MQLPLVIMPWIGVQLALNALVHGSDYVIYVGTTTIEKKERSRAIC